MKKYSFELEDILEYKKFDQEQAEQEFAKALSVENEIQQKIEYIAQQYLITKEKFKNTKDFNLIISQNQYFNLLDFQKEELLKELAQAKIITEQKKEILQEKMKATSALEKLKERDKEEYDQLVNFEENEFIDDLATKWSNIQTYKNNNDMPNYAIEVHSLKSDCKYLGFMTLDGNNKTFLSEKIQYEANKIVQDCYNETLDLLKNNINDLHIVSNHLFENETMTHEELKSLIRKEMC